MKYLITFASTTGNTQMLAAAIREALSPAECVNFGSTMMIAHHDIDEARRAYVGFWTDKGTCPDAVAELLGQLGGKEVFLFGTAGMGNSWGYFEGILARVREHLPRSAQVIGNFMCQGKMPAATRERYVQAAQIPEKRAQAEMLIENFDKAAGHPDQEDISRLVRTVRSL